VGDPEWPRFAGRYTVSYRPIDYQDKPFASTWRITPLCQYFACAGRLRSSGGLRGKVRLVGTSKTTYRVENPIGYTECVWRYPDQPDKEYPHGYRITSLINLRVVRSRNGRAITLAGRRTWTYTPTAIGKRRGCTRTVRDYDAVRLQAQ
jgi:hypothetical protein